MNGLVVSECDSGVRVQDSENIMMVGCLFRGTKKGPDISLDHDCRQITLRRIKLLAESLGSECRRSAESEDQPSSISASRNRFEPSNGRFGYPRRYGL